MGEVYLAEDMRINRQVAITVMRTEAELYPDPAAMQHTMRLFTARNAGYHDARSPAYLIRSSTLENGS
jgi:hypothetical protein